jgi:hypothetical protein
MKLSSCAGQDCRLGVRTGCDFAEPLTVHAVPVLTQLTASGIHAWISQFSEWAFGIMSVSSKGDEG